MLWAANREDTGNFYDYSQRLNMTCRTPGIFNGEPGSSLLPKPFLSTCSHSSGLRESELGFIFKFRTYIIEISVIKVEDCLESIFVGYSLLHNSVYICSWWGAEPFIMIAHWHSRTKTQEHYPLHLHELEKTESSNFSSLSCYFFFFLIRSIH